MKTLGLQSKLIMLIILLALLFNIERLVIDQDNHVVVSSFVYLLGFIGALLPFVIPVNGKVGSEILVAVIIGLYFFCSSVLDLGHPLWGSNTYLSATELVILVAIVNSAQGLAREGRLLLQQAELFSVTEQPFSCPTLEQERHKLEVEMARCRRYERNLGIILVEPEQTMQVGPESDQQLHPVISHSLMMRAIGQFLLRHVRRPDWVMNDAANNRFLIVCPESTHRDLETASNRLISSLHRQLSIAVKHGFATFPDDAVTSEGLILIALSRFQVSIADDQSVVKPLKQAVESTGG